MEVKRTIWTDRPLVRLLVCTLLTVLPLLGMAQNQAPRYTVKNGKMYIEVTRDLRESALDSFIVQFDLRNLYLKDFLKRNKPDSLSKWGWQVEHNNEVGFVISKLIEPFTNWNNPADRIRFSEQRPTFAERFPATNNGLQFGNNRFRNKKPFRTIQDSVVLFFLRGHLQASKVVLAGSFNDWKPDALFMKRTDSGWIAPVKLGAGKYWYKFIVDGNWITDNDNLVKENDGEGNINSIFFNTNKVFFLPGYENARKVYVAGSFNQWRQRDLEMTRTEGGWTLPLYLSEGTHAYKFIVDGNWIADERNPNKMPDGEGGYNSFIAFGKPHLFRLQGHTNAKKVQVAGSFNNWREFELAMKKTADGWELPYVLAPGNYEYKFLVDGEWLADPARPAAAPKGNSTMVLGPNYTFRLKGFGEAKQVFIAGDFNNWNPASFAMKKEGDEWVIPLHLWNGKHRYKFIVDGKWILDPANKLWEQNEHHTGNSVVWVGK